MLSRAKALRDVVDAASWPGHQDRRNTRLVTIGHSFGGLIVYTAISQYFIDRAVQTEAAPFARSLMPERARAGQEDGEEIAGYGDLVVVVNLAIEAMRFEPIRELMESRRSPGGFARTRTRSSSKSPRTPTGRPASRFPPDASSTRHSRALPAMASGARRCRRSVIIPRSGPIASKDLCHRRTRIRSRRPSMSTRNASTSPGLMLRNECTVT